MANQWFRLYSEFAFDPKVQMLSESDQRRLVMLFCLRCSNADVTLQDKHVTFQLRISNEEWAATKAVFIENGFIDADNNVLNWDKRQYTSDSSAERVARHREKARNAHVTACNVTVTPPDTESDTEQTQSQNLKSIDAAASPNSSTTSVVQFNPARAQTSQTKLLGDINPQIATDFIALRKAKKSPLTETAVNGIKREAAKVGYTLEQALTVCCERNWAGFKAEWITKDQPGAIKNKQVALEESNRAATAGWIPPELRGQHAN